MRHRKLKLAAAAAVAGVPLVPSSLEAAINAPAGLGSGDKFHLVFVTDGERDATSNNIADYDAFVADEAAAAGLGTYHGSPITWQALGSIEEGVTALSRFNPAVGVYRLDGAPIADDGTDLWDGTIQNPIDVTPTNASAVAADVWTGTNADGSEAKGLGGQFFPGFEGVPPGVYTSTGLTSSSDSGWVNVSSNTTDQFNRLYAFSSELTVVPEPASAGLLAVGAAGLAGLRRGKRRK